MRITKKSLALRVTLSFTIMFSLVLGSLVMPKSSVHAATLTDGSLSLSDSRPTETATYTLDLSNVTTSAIQCIEVVLSDSATGGSAPTGIDTSGVALDGTSDYIPTPASWNADGTTTNGTITITYASGETPAASSARTLVLTGIDNGSTVDTPYYVQFTTYTDDACTGGNEVDVAGISFIYTTGQLVSLTVDPVLSYTITGVNSGLGVNGDTTTDTTTSLLIPFGVVSSSTNAIGAQDMNITTNATNGYTLFTRYTAALTNGDLDTITDHTGTNAAPSAFSAAGTESFGYTSEDSTLGTGTADRFTNPAGGYAAFTTSNAEVAFSATGVTAETIRVGYQVGIAATTEAGEYTTTVIYTLTPTY